MTRRGPGLVTRYIQAWVSRLTAVATAQRIFPCFFTHALLQMRRKVVLDDELTLDDTLGSCVGA